MRIRVLLSSILVVLAGCTLDAGCTCAHTPHAHDDGSCGDGGVTLGPCPGAPDGGDCASFATCGTCDPVADPLCVTPVVACSIPGALAPECSTSEWCSRCVAGDATCSAGECRKRGMLGDTCALGLDVSCQAGLYCSFASGVCETLPRTDCTP